MSKVRNVLSRAAILAIIFNIGGGNVLATMVDQEVEVIQGNELNENHTVEELLGDTEVQELGKEELEEVNSAVLMEDLSPEKEPTEAKEVAQMTALAISSIFPDANLANEIANVLGKNVTDTVTQQELEAVIELVVISPEGTVINSLEGINLLVNLRKFHFTGNEADAISATPLSQLTQLEDLKLVGSVSDLSALSTLIQLQKIELNFLFSNGSNPNDVNYLSNLTELREVEIAGGSITDFAGLNNLSKLEKLRLPYGFLVSIAPLLQLSSKGNLTELFLGGNPIADISGIEQFSQLNNLNLSFASVNDITPLSSLIALETLSISISSAVSDLTPLSGLVQLTSLEIGKTYETDGQVTDVTPLQSLVNLEDLSLAYNNISDISPLAQLHQLKQVNIYQNNVSDLSPLEDLPNLTGIFAKENHIESIPSSFLNRSNLRIDAGDQTVYLPEIQFADTLAINAPIYFGEEVMSPQLISDNGEFDATTGMITWHNLSPQLNNVSYTFATIQEVNNSSIEFSGVVNQGVADQGALATHVSDEDPSKVPSNKGTLPSTGEQASHLFLIGTSMLLGLGMVAVYQYNRIIKAKEA